MRGENPCCFPISRKKGLKKNKNHSGKNKKEKSSTLHGIIFNPNNHENKKTPLKTSTVILNKFVFQ